MKKRVLMSLLLLIAVGTSAVFAQNTGKYYLEIYNISKATFDTIDRSTTTMREDDYFLARTASGTTVRSKDRDLTLEQVRQKLVAIGPQATTYVNSINKDVIPILQQRWSAGGIGFSTTNGQYDFTIYFWVRRTE
jgi:hypothetical protein